MASQALLCISALVYPYSVAITPGIGGNLTGQAFLDVWIGTVVAESTPLKSKYLGVRFQRFSF